MHKSGIQTPYRAFIRVSSPLTVWWWLGDFVRALFSSFPLNFLSAQGERCVVTSPSRMMLYLHAACPAPSHAACHMALLVRLWPCGGYRQSTNLKQEFSEEGCSEWLCSLQPKSLLTWRYHHITYFLALFIKTSPTERYRDVSRKVRNILREATEKHLQWGKHHKVGWNVQSQEETDEKQVENSGDSPPNFGKGREMEERDTGEERLWRKKILK